jgi:hypothetical protein
MKTEFVPYEEALALKELGFDEICFGYYTSPTGLLLQQPTGGNGEFVYYAPLYQQAFRWFREKHEIHSFIDCKWKNLGWEFQLVDLSKMETISSIDRYNYKTYEEAELACLRKLIEIVKEK